jgi:hypothetical protein
MLIKSKHEGYKAGIRLYLLSLGGGSAPPPPDYAAAAKETASGNLEAARYATNANRINQVTPYGSLTYTKAQPTFNQAGYDQALADYNKSGGAAAQPQAQTSQNFSPEGQDNPINSGASGNFLRAVGGGGLTGQAPRREDFMGPDDGGGWTQTMNLTPQAQATLDKQMNLSNQYADVATTGFNNIRGLMENPNINTSGMPQMRGIDMSQVGGVRDLTRGSASDVRSLSTEGLNNVRALGGGSAIRSLDINGLPQAPINPGQTAQDALYSRMNPSLARDEEALRTRLANQGIQLGSSAYNREMDLQGQRSNDMRLQAAAQGIGLDQAARNAAFGERKDLSNFDLSVDNQKFNQSAAQTAADLAQRNQAFNERMGMSNFDLNRSNQQFGQNQAMSNFDLQRTNQQFGQQQALANLSGQQRNQALQEAYTAQSRPLDLVNSLRTGAQVQNPQFQNFAQQQTTAGPDMLGAANAQYGAAMNNYNADQASSNAMMGGLMSMGGQFLGSGAGSAAVAGLF